MALVVRRLHLALKGILCESSSRILLAAQQSRLIGSTSPCFNEENDGNAADEGSGGPDEEGLDSSSSTVQADVVKEHVKPPPYAQELRKIMVAKYLSNQPIAQPHAHCEEFPEKLSLAELRTQYKKKVAAVRKQYIFEREEKIAAKAAQDKRLREAIRVAKEKRLLLKKEKSAKRAIEVAEEKRLLQEQLAKETEARRGYRKMKDKAIEERQQRKRDVIRQESGNWIEEKDLEERIVQAFLNPVEL